MNNVAVAILISRVPRDSFCETFSYLRSCYDRANCELNLINIKVLRAFPKNLSDKACINVFNGK